jgi:hypothetical protein
VLPPFRHSDSRHSEPFVGHDALRVQNPEATLEPALLDLLFDLQQHLAEALLPSSVEPVGAVRLEVLGKRLADPPAGMTAE